MMEQDFTRRCARNKKWYLLRRTNIVDPAQQHFSN